MVYLSPGEKRKRLGEWREYVDKHITDYKRTVEEIHKYKPKYIFLAETAVIASGYLIREALKKAYPGDPLPKFYRINPRAVNSIIEEGRKVTEGDASINPNKFNKRKERLANFFKQRIIDKDAKILIYDDWDEGHSPGAIVNLLKSPLRFGFENDIKCSNVKMNGRLNDGKERPLGGSSDSRKLKEFAWEYLDIDDTDIAPVHDMAYGNVSPLTSKTRGQVGDPENNLRGRILRKKDYQEYIFDSPKQYIEECKTIGRRVAIEIINDIHKKKSLENRISGFVGALGLLYGVFTLSNPITGNVVGQNLSSNWLGAISFIVGSVGFFNYLRTK